MCLKSNYKASSDICLRGIDIKKRRTNSAISVEESKILRKIYRGEIGRKMVQKNE